MTATELGSQLMALRQGLFEAFAIRDVLWAGIALLFVWVGSPSSGTNLEWYRLQRTDVILPCHAASLQLGLQPVLPPMRRNSGSFPLSDELATQPLLLLERYEALGSRQVPPKIRYDSPCALLTRKKRMDA